MADFEIRVACADDAGAVTALLQASYAQLLTPHYTPAQLAAALPLMTQARPDLLTSGTYFVAVGHADGAVIGCGGWSRAAPEGADTPGRAHIRHFATSPDCVRGGVGRRILQRCIREIRAAGLVETECLSTVMAEPFYAAQGFRRVATVDARLSAEVTFPAIWMLLRL